MNMGMDMTERVAQDRARWEELAQSHGLSIVAADSKCIRVALHSGVLMFAIDRAALTAGDGRPGDAFFEAAMRLHRGHTRRSPRRDRSGRE